MTLANKRNNVLYDHEMDAKTKLINCVFIDSSVRNSTNKNSRDGLLLSMWIHGFEHPFEDEIQAHLRDAEKRQLQNKLVLLGTESHGLAENDALQRHDGKIISDRRYQYRK